MLALPNRPVIPLLCYTSKDSKDNIPKPPVSSRYCSPSPHPFTEMFGCWFFTWFASGTYQSSFASLVWGHVYFSAVAAFVSKVQRSLFFSTPYPNSRRSTILEFLSEPKGQLFGMSFQFLRGYAFLLWFRVCAWFLSRSFPGMWPLVETLPTLWPVISLIFGLLLALTYLYFCGYSSGKLAQMSSLTPSQHSHLLDGYLENSQGESV